MNPTKNSPLKIVTLATLSALTLSACGQNPHLVEKDSPKKKDKQPQIAILPDPSADITLLQSQKKEAESKLAETQAALDEAKKRAAELETARDALNGELASEKEAHKTAQEKTKEEAQDLEDRLNQAQELQDELNDTLTETRKDTQETLAKAEAEKQADAKKITDLINEISRLESDSVAQQDKIRELETLVSQLSEQLEKTSAELASTQRRNGELEKTLTDLFLGFVDIQNQYINLVIEFEQERAAHQADNKRDGTRIRELEEQLLGLEVTIEKQKSEIAQKETELAASKEREAELMATNDRLTHQVSSLNQQLEIATDTVSELEDSLSQTKDLADKQKAELESQIASHKDRISQLESELEKKAEEKRAAEEAILAAKTQRNLLIQVQLDTMRWNSPLVEKIDGTNLGENCNTLGQLFALTTGAEATSRIENDRCVIERTLNGRTVTHYFSVGDRIGSQVGNFDVNDLESVAEITILTDNTTSTSPEVRTTLQMIETPVFSDNRHCDCGTTEIPSCEIKPADIIVINQTPFIDYDANIQFDSGKAKLTAKGQEEAEKIIAVILKNLKAGKKIARVTITGHSDDIGTEAANQKLSQRRAEAVRTYLAQQIITYDEAEDTKWHQVLVAEGKGESEPKYCTNKATKEASANCLNDVPLAKERKFNATDRYNNRRVQVQLFEAMSK